MVGFLLTICLFTELLVLAGLGCILLAGGLPHSPQVVLYVGGVLFMFCAVIAWTLPKAWSRRAGLHGALIAGSLIFILPFVWLVGTSFKYAEETFVSPPRWVPMTVNPPEVSPYVCLPAGRAAVDNEHLMGDALWQRCVDVIPPDELGRVDPESARRYMSAELADIAPQHLNREAIEGAWDRVYRAVILGPVTVTDVRLQAHEAPPGAVTWKASDGIQLIRDNPPEIPVLYDMAGHDSLMLTCVIDRDWINQQCGDDGLLSVSVPMRQDRSWHRLKAKLLLDGNEYCSHDSLYLGGNAWRTVAFKLAERDDSDERKLGVFPLTRDGKAAPPAGDGVVLELTIEHNGPVTATLAKYTQTYRDAWYADQLWPRYLLNSVLLVVLNVAGQLLGCSMAAYALSRLRWPGREFVFFILISTMMLPVFVTIIPQFLIFKQLGWYNTLLPLWVPAFFGMPFFIFLLRQFMMGVPRELEEAARIDGCSWFGIYARVILPLMKPALAAVAVFTFMDTWNEFMKPLIYISDQRLYPLSLGLFNFRSSHASAFGMLMSASTLMTLPVIAMFFLCQRYFVQGVTLTGMKG